MIQAIRQEEKVALITGAARRIGAAIAKGLHHQGFKVAIHCHHSISDAEKLAAALNHLRRDSARVFQLDLRITEGIPALIAKVKAWEGRLDVLVNNASLFSRTHFKAVERCEWQELFTVNVHAPFLLSTEAFPLLELSQGVIINITDIHAEKPLKGYAAYCQTKAALLMQTRSLALEFAPKVRVNAVAPGAIAWPEHENELSVDVQRNIIEETPMRRHGDPVYVADAVKALIENAFITGQVLNVDGGRSLK